MVLIQVPSSDEVLPVFLLFINLKNFIECITKANSYLYIVDSLNIFLCVCFVALADIEGKNLASLLLHCVQLTDGVSQIHYVKQVRLNCYSRMHLEDYHTVKELKFA